MNPRTRRTSSGFRVTDMPAISAVARGRQQERRQDPQRRGLAGAVGSDQAEDLALLDGQVDAGHGERAVVALDQALGADDLGHFTSPVIARSRLNPTPSAIVVDEPDEHACRSPGRRSGRVRRRRTGSRRSRWGRRFHGRVDRSYSSTSGRPSKFGLGAALRRLPRRTARGIVGERFDQLGLDAKPGSPKFMPIASSRGRERALEGDRPVRTARPCRGRS